MISPVFTKIYMPKLKRDYTFIHITDTHLTLYREDDDQETNRALKPLTTYLQRKDFHISLNMPKT